MNRESERLIEAYYLFILKLREVKRVLKRKHITPNLRLVLFILVLFFPDMDEGNNII